MKVYKMTQLPEVLYGETACFFAAESLDGITAEFENAEEGEKFQIEIVDMSKKALYSMPEFEGW